MITRTLEEEIARLERQLANAEQVRDGNLALALFATRKCDNAEKERNNYRAMHAEAMRALGYWWAAYPERRHEIEEDRFNDSPDYEMRGYIWPSPGVEK